MSKTKIEVYPNSLMAVSKFLNKKQFNALPSKDRLKKINKLERETFYKDKEKYKENIDDLEAKIAFVDAYLIELQTYLQQSDFGIQKQVDEPIRRVEEAKEGDDYEPELSGAGLNADEINAIENKIEHLDQQLARPDVPAVIKARMRKERAALIKELEDDEAEQFEDAPGSEISGYDEIRSEYDEPESIKAIDPIGTGGTYSYLLVLLRKILQEIILLTSIYKSKIYKKAKFYNIFDLQKLGEQILDLYEMYDNLYTGYLDDPVGSNQVFAISEKIKKQFMSLINMLSTKRDKVDKDMTSISDDIGTLSSLGEDTRSIRSNPSTFNVGRNFLDL